MEAQAKRRLAAETVAETEAKRVWLALLRARKAAVSLYGRLAVAPACLNLGPHGRLFPRGA